MSPLYYMNMYACVSFVSVIVYDGTPGVETWARSPQALVPGMNCFLQQLDITFRRDPTNFRPRYTCDFDDAKSSIRCDRTFIYPMNEYVPSIMLHYISFTSLVTNIYS